MATGSEGGFFNKIRNLRNVAVAGLALGGTAEMVFDGYGPISGSPAEARVLKVSETTAEKIGEKIAEDLVETIAIQRAGNKLNVGEETTLVASKSQLNNVVEALAKGGNMTYKEAVAYCQNVDSAMVKIEKKADEVKVGLRDFLLKRKH